MLRFPNPGSDIDSFIRIFRELFEALSSKESFSLDDMSSTLVERNLATSCGFMGQEALSRSTREDRSRDPLYNQSKSYSELFKVLGWIHPLTHSRLNFRFTYFGVHVVAARQDPAAIFRESALGIAYPNPILDVTGDHRLRPFATILRTLKALDRLLTRDELIIGPLCLDDDRNEELFKNMIEEILSLRGNWQNLVNKMREVSARRGISRNTMRNYTRFPLAVLRWTGWTNPERNREIYGRSIKFDRLTDIGYEAAELIEESRDIRGSDLEGINKVIKDAIVRLSFYQILERAGFDTSSIKSELIRDKETGSSFLGSTSCSILFSPFQELSPDYLLTIFPNPSGSETNETSADLFSTLAGVQISEYLHSSVELKFRSGSGGKNIDTEIFKLFKQAMEPYNDLDNAVKSIAGKYAHSNKDEFYPFIAKLFRAIGYNCEHSRPGVNYQRWDALISDPEHSIPIEIKSPVEEEFISVKAVRQALENRVILLARGVYPTRPQDTSLVVGYNLPNNRSEVTSLINDIFKAYNIVIGIIDFRSLLKIVGAQLFFEKAHNKDQLVKLYGIIKLSDS